MTNNANTYKAYGGTSLGVPSNFTSEFDQNSYNKIAKLDNNLSSYPTTGAGYIRQVLLSYNVLDFLKKQLGEEYFTAQGALSNSEQVELIKPKITNDRGNVYGYGVGAGGNKLTFAVWNVRWLNWSVTRSSTTATVSNISIPINNAKEYIDSDGNCHFIAYAPVSDDSTASAANLDYANYQFTIELSMNEFIQSMIATNQVENLATQEEAKTGEDNTKTMTPLRTDQYFKAHLATEEEAESGSSTNKYMTPLRVFQAISKWVQGKFVNKTGDESISGKKIFLIYLLSMVFRLR